MSYYRPPITAAQTPIYRLKTAKNAPTQTFFVRVSLVASLAGWASRTPPPPPPPLPPLQPPHWPACGGSWLHGRRRWPRWQWQRRWRWQRQEDMQEDCAHWHRTQSCAHRHTVPTYPSLPSLALSTDQTQLHNCRLDPQLPRQVQAAKLVQVHGSNITWACASALTESARGLCGLWDACSTCVQVGRTQRGCASLRWSSTHVPSSAVDGLVLGWP